jgi:hypothetical protein
MMESVDCSRTDELDTRLYEFDEDITLAEYRKAKRNLGLFHQKKTSVSARIAWADGSTNEIGKVTLGPIL